MRTYERINEDITETIEKRSSSVVVVRVCKPKFAIKERDRLEPTKISQASPPELPVLIQPAYQCYVERFSSFDVSVYRRYWRFGAANRKMSE